MGHILIAKRIGMEKGQAKMRQQLQHRFGPVDVETTQLVQFAELDELETWLLNMLDTTTMEEAFRD